MTRLGLLGGTFDPIHRGHLDVARAARRALNLDRILLVPAQVPPHRNLPQASAAHRFAMVALAVEAAPHLVVSDLEIGNASPSYTAVTLDRLALSGVDMRRVFVVTGADAFQEIRTWRDYPALLDRCHFVVVSRPGCPASSLRAALPDLSGRMVDAPDARAEPAIFLVDVDTAPVSATDIRRRVATGQSITDLVPPPVAAYIEKHGLYTGDASKGLA